MNVLIPRVLNYLNAHKTKAVVILVLLNVLATYIKLSSELTTYGRVEALGYQWATYSTLYKQAFSTRAVFSKIGESSTKVASYRYNYQESEVKGNSFISLGDSKTLAISHKRIFNLDDKCSLFFSGQDKLAMTNFSLRCFD